MELRVRVVREDQNYFHQSLNAMQQRRWIYKLPNCQSPGAGSRSAP